ncbi:MAG: RluA family pseudouridine synthase [Clostridia bacterium]|nr:RluA family pseudouridine synthase [Clostridia bacterium]
METVNFVYDEQSPKRIDAYLSDVLELTRSHAARLLEQGCVRVGDKTAGKSQKVKMGDNITVVLPDPVPLDVTAENIPLDIVYEDDDLLVVNKPKGMVVHPAAGNYSGTLVNALMYHCRDNLSGINGVLRPGILHRIDKDTSGLLLVAKNDAAHVCLAEQIKEHSLTREYETIVYGNVKADKGTVDAPIARHPIKRKQMAVVDGGKDAVTHYEVIERLNGFTHLRCRLETGRTHQIRVHMSSLGHAVVGDTVYGPKKVITELNGQCLHARKIGFIHPRSRKYMEFNSDLPEYFTVFLNKKKER